MRFSKLVTCSTGLNIIQGEEGVQEKNVSTLLFSSFHLYWVAQWSSHSDVPEPAASQHLCLLLLWKFRNSSCSWTLHSLWSKIEFPKRIWLIFSNDSTHICALLPFAPVWAIRETDCWLLTPSYLLATVKALVAINRSHMNHTLVFILMSLLF